MRYVGQAAKKLRQRLGLTQETVAEKLGVTVVHLSSIENDRARPSAKLLEKYYDEWGVDLYVMSWCDDSNLSQLPDSIRAAASKLHRAWNAQVEATLEAAGAGE